MSQHRFGGEWTDEKLGRVAKYLSAYTKIFEANERARFFTTIYIDAFAGSGGRDASGGDTDTVSLFADIESDEEAHQFEAGSAANALEVSPGFDRYVFIESDPRKVAALWSPVLRKFLGIKFALSEAGVGWIPFFLERVDYVYHQHRAWTHQDFGDKLPSEVFREHVVTCFITDRAGIQGRHTVGVENITWECDYPHSDSAWLRSPERLGSELEGVPDAEINLMTHENAMREFRYDPFAHVPRDQATVGRCGPWPKM